MSGVDSLLLADLEITLAPGFVEPFRVVPSAGGLVLIVGPNESGKSTLARALSNVLWPGSMPMTELECEAHFQLGARRLRAVHRDRRSRWFEAGTECAAPSLPPLELASCYRLAVDESRASTAPLAEQIVRALAGGFDLAEARKSFPQRPVGRSAEYSEWKQARDALARLLSEEDQVAGHEARLESLQQQLAAQRGLKEQAPALEACHQLQAAQAQLSLLKPELESLAGCERVNPGHMTRLSTLVREVESARKALRAAQADLDQTRRSLNAAPLPEEARDLALLEGCRSDARRLIELERRRDAAVTALATAEGSFKRWGSQGDSPDLPSLPEQELLRFDSLSKQWLELQLGENQGKRVESILAVTARPSSAPRPAPLPLAVAVAATGLIVGGLVAGLMFQPQYLGLAALGLLVLVVGWYRRPQAAPPGDPTEAVLRHLEQESRQRVARRSELEAQLRPFESDWGLSPGLSSATMRESLQQRAKDHGDFRGARAAADKAEADFDALCDALMARVQSCGQEPRQSASGLLEQIETAIDRARERIALLDGERAQLGSLENAKQALSRAEDAVASLYAEAGLEPGDREGLQRLIEQRERFKRLQAEQTIAAHARDRAAESLKDWPGPSPASAAELAECIAASRHAAAQVDLLTTEIRDIERDIALRRNKDVIEAARARVRAAEDALSALREQSLEATGALALLEDVERDMESGMALPVFSRAIELFSTFTGGRHRLSLEKGAEGRADFRAHDLLLQRDVALDELSSGTRAQLLLAARVAFAVEEAHKAGVRPPLVLDEALATSDEVRFEAIARAVLVLVTEGWQVLYLTSQRSDLERWGREAKRIEGLRFEVIELDRVRRQASAVHAAKDLLLPATRQIPAPGKQSAEAYALELQVPPFDLEQPLGNQHVFHLFRDELDCVHQLVQARAERLAIAERQARDGVGVLDARRRADLLARIELLRVFQELWGVGRGRPVDPAGLRDEVTPKFMDPMLALARKHGNDAALLIEALESKGLTGFGSTKTEALAQSLQAQAYLDRRTRLELDEIVGRAISAVPALPAALAARLCEQWWHAAGTSWRRRREQAASAESV